MDAASNRGIEEIRNLRDNINYLPTSLKRKVYIIDEAHMLTKEAFNALLKTLEEPPEHVIFILATTEAHKIPITILSRVERYDFRLGTKEEVVSKLKKIVKAENKKIDPEAWDVIYMKSGGSFRDAESLLGKIISNTQEDKITKEYVFNVLGIYSEDDIDRLVNSIMDYNFSEFKKALDSIDNLSGNINTLLDQALELLHSKVIELTLSNKPINKHIEIINLFIKTKKDIRDFSDKKMIFELNVINFMGLKNQKPNSQIKETKAIEDKPIKNVAEKKVELKKEPIEEASLLVKIASHPEVSLPRLKAILLNSTYEIEGNKLIINNSYKFNVNILKKEENIKLISVVAREIDSSITEIIIQQVEKVKGNEVEIETVSVKIDVKSEEVLVDNSDIIENIL
jgi:DNA polymerase-3 subunit gamma/tau